MTHPLLIFSPRKSTSFRKLLFYWRTQTFRKQRWSRSKGLRSHYCCTWNKLLETHNWSQERGSGGANEESAYFQPAACLGQQHLSVWYRRAEDIEVVWPGNNSLVLALSAFSFLCLSVSLPLFLGWLSSLMIVCTVAVSGNVIFRHRESSTKLLGWMCRMVYQIWYCMRMCGPVPGN
jgi:hypothetical protein